MLKVYADGQAEPVLLVSGYAAVAVETRLKGDRFVIEADGREWHEGGSAFHADRIRDLALLRLGYVVIRVSYPLIMSEWMLVELSVRALIGRREHLWSATHRREGLAR